MSIYLNDENATLEAGSKLANWLQSHKLNTEIHLIGDLGAGKTTLARGFLERLGWDGAVKSPTYTLCEEYLLRGFFVIHCDLYRLNTFEDFELLNLDRNSPLTKVLLIEWPDKLALKRKPDIEIHLLHKDKGRELKLMVADGSLKIPRELL
ncbi:MAG: tRNA (adenosine(37)-N6)-threonylcarbamoyltransferase complex ATPase subunit type 1 TsaE [Gammaproteobacteria bacterium]